LLQETSRPDWDGAALWKKVPHHDRGSAVLARSGTFRALRFTGYEGWVVGGQWQDSGLNVNDRPLFVISVHTPSHHHSHPRGSYVKEVLTILDMVARKVPPDTDLILGGDFNIALLCESKNTGGLQMRSAERKVHARLKDMSLVSCWSAAHQDRALAQTLRWTGDKTPGRSTPYHCDGIFVPSSWQPGIICEVLTSTCFEVSDHYPVAAWISR